jgi:hypothetical protein
MLCNHPVTPPLLLEFYHTVFCKNTKDTQQRVWENLEKAIISQEIAALSVQRQLEHLSEFQKFHNTCCTTVVQSTAKWILNPKQRNDSSSENISEANTVKKTVEKY